MGGESWNYPGKCRDVKGLEDTSNTCDMKAKVGGYWGGRKEPAGKRQRKKMEMKEH